MSNQRETAMRWLSEMSFRDWWPIIQRVRNLKIVDTVAILYMTADAPHVLRAPMVMHVKRQRKTAASITTLPLGTGSTPHASTKSNIESA
jgi:hypothetical protein